MDRGTSFLLLMSERLPTLIAEQAERLNVAETVILDYLDAGSLEALVREPTAGILDFDEDAIATIGGSLGKRDAKVAAKLNRPDFGGDSILWRKMESWQSAAAVPTPPNGGIRRS